MKHTATYGLYTFRYDLDGQLMITYNGTIVLVVPLIEMLIALINHQRTVYKAMARNSTVEILRDGFAQSFKPMTYPLEGHLNLESGYSQMNDEMDFYIRGGKGEDQRTQVPMVALRALIKDYFTNLDLSRK